MDWKKTGKYQYEFTNSSGIKWIYNHFNSLFPEYIETDYLEKDGKKVYWTGTNKRVSRWNAVHFKRHSSSIIYSDKIQWVYSVPNSELNYYQDILKTATSDNDKIFVVKFLDTCKTWMNKLQSMDCKLIILNFAVFRNLEDRLEQPWYLIKSFYNLYFEINQPKSVF